jgi:RNase P subunit RPR2
MTREVPIDEAEGFFVLRWHSGEDGLSLRVRGQNEEVRPVCRCGRRHWIVREGFFGGRATLVITCHNCGTRAAFPMEVVNLSTA